LISRDLNVGGVYAVHHKRKGHFKAQLIAIVPSADDPQDSILLTMKMDTRETGGQSHLARSPSGVTVTNIRPSLIVSIEEMPDEDWLMQIRVPEEKKLQSSLSRWDKLLARLGFRG